MGEIISVILSVTAGVYLYHLLEWVYYRISDKIWEWKSKEEIEKFEQYVKSLEKAAATPVKKTTKKKV